MKKVSNTQVPVAVIGGSGYSGRELLRLLKYHPRFKATFSGGRETKVADLPPDIQAVFLCTPNEASHELALNFIDRGISVIDLSGAFRLKKHSYPEWYGWEHTSPKGLQISTYGLYPWIKTKPSSEPQLIANPGCFATAILMTLLPPLKKKILSSSSISIDAKSGTTGAGKKPEARLLHAEVAEDILPYRIGRHQHWPEIVESLESLLNESVRPVLVTELLPVLRGISIVTFGEWARPGLSADDLRLSYRECYEGHPDIEILSEGEVPRLRDVCYTNRIQISCSEAYGRPVLMASIDNLVRGAAGQALVNANGLFGFPHQLGLEQLTLSDE